jgi:aspartyl-tRNA(Asn)/glutamyl-tRNA(Gln) amidotransferase subunit B
LTLSNDFVESIRNEIPELPLAKRKRFIALGLNKFEAATLSEDRARANYFDSLVLALEEKSNRAAKLAANWMLGEVARWDNEHVHEDLSDFPIAVEALTELILLAEDGVITSSVAKQVFERMIGSGLRASQIVEEHGLAQMGEDVEGELVQIVRSVIDENDKALSDYLTGKSSALKFLLGQVMRQTKGRADHKLIQTLLEAELKALE